MPEHGVRAELGSGFCYRDGRTNNVVVWVAVVEATSGYTHSTATLALRFTPAAEPMKMYVRHAEMDTGIVRSQPHFTTPLTTKSMPSKVPAISTPTVARAAVARL